MAHARSEEHGAIQGSQRVVVENFVSSTIWTGYI